MVYTGCLLDRFWGGVRFKSPHERTSYEAAMEDARYLRLRANASMRYHADRGDCTRPYIDPADCAVICDGRVVEASVHPVFAGILASLAVQP